MVRLACLVPVLTSSAVVVVIVVVTGLRIVVVAVVGLVVLAVRAVLDGWVLVLLCHDDGAPCRAMASRPLASLGHARPQVRRTRLGRVTPPEP